MHCTDSLPRARATFKSTQNSSQPHSRGALLTKGQNFIPSPPIPSLPPPVFPNQLRTCFSNTDFCPPSDSRPNNTIPHIPRICAGYPFLRQTCVRGQQSWLRLTGVPLGLFRRDEQREKEVGSEWVVGMWDEAGWTFYNIRSPLHPPSPSLTGTASLSPTSLPFPSVSSAPSSEAPHLPHSLATSALLHQRLPHKYVPPRWWLIAITMQCSFLFPFHLLSYHQLRSTPASPALASASIDTLGTCFSRTNLCFTDSHSYGEVQYADVEVRGRLQAKQGEAGLLGAPWRFLRADERRGEQRKKEVGEEKVVRGTSVYHGALVQHPPTCLSTSGLPPP
ncbi:unnamed protein product [Closterium sp. NIES-65]|nr:unnamed protein product [Closterium sp. NIES-65]CAI5994699.1 unnamed protein product [Closterium sp. NIES-65]